jgi:hypothetical protein
MTHKPSCRLPILFISLLCIGLLFGDNASAEVKNACTDDIAKFCQDVKPGHGSIMGCLEKHETELTEACKDHEQKMGGSRMERREAVRAQVRMRQSCKDDVAQFCKDMKPGTGGIAACLSGNESKLSASCRQALQATKEEKKKTD